MRGFRTLIAAAMLAVVAGACGMTGVVLPSAGGGAAPLVDAATPEPTAEVAVESEATPAITLPSTYNTPSKRTWAKVVKAPDKYIGKGLKLWACIFQFDAATGEDGFLANASYKKQTYWNLYGDNAAFGGDAGKLSDFVEGDIVTLSVVILGSYSYDTQAGGNTTVPSFQVVKIKRQKGDCS
ncbi:MAG TPA: hypothetical protein VGK16_08640 [Candidatus Limnocylindrales bacterium]|jgi:hypothetical protein